MSQELIRRSFRLTGKLGATTLLRSRVRGISVRTSLQKSMAVLQLERQQLLEKVYSPFNGLDKSSSEYHELAKSGRAWYNFFQPGNSDKMGYTKLQHRLSGLLDEIDSFRNSMKQLVRQAAKILTAEYAHQSVQLEGNPIKFGDSLRVSEYLTERLFNQIDLASMSAQNISLLEIPDLTSILQNTSHLRELTNHIVASHWIAEVAANAPGTAGLNERDVRGLGAAAIKGTDTEAAATRSWGSKTAPGDYRTFPIQVTGNPLRIFPYHLEVPALMARFFEWRDQAHREKRLHPMILACQLTIYFLHIHPFGDGNGRVGRMLMHDYLVRQGFVPVVMLDLERGDYLRMVSDAQDGHPEEFVFRILETQLEELQTFKWREFAAP